jgi:hypothetical protein
LPESKDEQLLNRYLLEGLSEEERERVEESYLTDDDVFMKLQVAEDELIVAYLEGGLSRGDRAKFERAFLTNPHKLRKVESTKELLEFFAPGPPAPRPGLLGSFLQSLSGLRPADIYALAGLLLVVACGLSCWLLVERQRMRGELDAARERLRQIESAQPRQTPAQTPQPTPEEVLVVPPAPPGSTPRPERETDAPETQGPKQRSRPTPDGGALSRAASVLAYALPSPGALTRGGGGRVAEPLVIHSDDVLVRLSVKVMANEYTTYKVSVQKLGDPEGTTQIVRKGQPGTGGDQVRIDLPASSLTSGDYILKIMGENEILALHQIKITKQNRPRE